MSCATRSAPMRAGGHVLALLEPKARLGAEGVALAGPADAHRVEDGRLDDDVGRPVRHLGRGAAHHAGDADDRPRVGDDEGLRVERRARRGRASRGARPARARRTTIVPVVATAAASNVWVGLPISSMT